MPKKVASRKHLTRQEKRDLDIEIGFLEGIVQRDPTYVDALQLLGGNRGPGREQCVELDR